MVTPFVEDIDGQPATGRPVELLPDICYRSINGSGLGEPDGLLASGLHDLIEVAVVVHRSKALQLGGGGTRRSICSGRALLTSDGQGCHMSK